MNEYLTVEEKANEWKVSVRAVQLMCSKGKIKGSAKKAGIWFIPKKAQKPVDGRKK